MEELVEIFVEEIRMKIEWMASGIVKICLLKKFQAKDLVFKIRKSDKNYSNFIFFDFSIDKIAEKVQKFSRILREFKEC